MSGRIVLGKLFKKNKTPQNGGTGESELPTKLVTKYYLNAKSIKGKPLFELTDKHIIGSEEGDIILEEKTISAAHMQVELVDGVVTVMDLGSEKGSFLGKKQIDPNKKVILRDGDVLKLGKVKIIFEEVDEEIPDLDAESAHVMSEEVDDQVEAEQLVDESEEVDTPAQASPAEPDVAATSNNLSPEDKTGGLTLDDSAPEGEEANDLSDGSVQEDTTGEIIKEDTKANQGLKVTKEELDAVEEEKEKTQKTFKLQLYDYDKPDPDSIYEYDEIDDEKADKTLTRKIMSALNIGSKPDKVKVKSSKGVVSPAANAIVRFLGLLFDVIVFSLVFSMLPMQKMILTQVDQVITKGLAFITPLFKAYALKYVDMAYKQVPALAKMQDEVVKNYKPEYYEYIQVFFVFVAFQMVMTLVFGVTLGQFFFGMKALGNFFLKRLMGPVRVLLNYLLFPFFILFELPTVFSKRSFKEILTFTHIEMTSKFRVFLTLFVIIPLMAFGFIVSPIFKDFTVPKPVKVIANRTFKISKDKNNFEQGSKALKLLYENETASFFPMIKTIQKEGKKHIILGARIINLTGESVESIEILQEKSLNLSKFFKQYTKLNPMVYLNHPTLLSIVNDASNNNPNFKDTKFPKDKIAQELQNVLEGALSFDVNQLDKVQSFMVKYGPFFTGHMNIREKLLKLVDESINQVAIKQNGQAFAIHISTEIEKKKFLYVIPLNSIKSYVYKIQYETNEQISEIDKIRLNVPSGVSTYASLNFLKIYSKETNPELKVDEVFQNTYKILFENSKKFISSQNAKALALLQKSIREMVGLLEINDQTTKLNKDVVDKMIQNLNDLLQAIVDKDANFFGIKKTKTV